MSTRTVICLALILPAALAAGATIPGPASAPARASHELPAAADTTDDGPYVYWRDEHTAIAMSVCDGEVVERSFRVSNTLRLSGVCGDSSVEYVMAARRPAVEPHTFDRAPRIIAVSDIHGEYEALVELLHRAGVVDDKLAWGWGTGHLVVVGDIFDRGDRVNECLWLLHRLEREARSARGRVHVVLGNHEIMAMRGDYRYVNAKYLEGLAQKKNVKYEDLYGPETELGRWLRSKHAAVRVNGILFVHGGLPPELSERGYTLATLNRAVRANIDISSLRYAFSDTARYLFGSRGPFWYRGYLEPLENRYPQATPEQVNAILAAYGARAIVVGHTEVEQVESLYSGKVFALDVPVERLGGLQALLWQDGRFFRVTGTGALEPF
jgi:hypothetical protein